MIELSIESKIYSVKSENIIQIDFEVDKIIQRIINIMKTFPFHYHEFICKNVELLERFIDAYPLALITRYMSNGFITSHIPLFQGVDKMLFGHTDRRNPMVNDLVSFEAHIVFMGPSSYIPPEAYKNRQLPTWNYTAVHMDASIDIIVESSMNLNILLKTSERLATGKGSFRPNKEDPRVVKNLPGILGLKVVPKYIEGRFKLSQDEPFVDHESAMQWLLDNNPSEFDSLIKSLING